MSDLVFETTFTEYFLRSPLFIVWLSGAIIVVMRLRRQPGQSALALTGLVLLIAAGAAAVPLELGLAEWLYERQVQSCDLVQALSLRTFGLALAQAVGFGLVLAALFVRPREVRVSSRPQGTESNRRG